MFHSEALRFSFQALQANKFRAFLTACWSSATSVILVVTISLTSRDYILTRSSARIQSDLRAV
jgi:hypothetical protein